MGGSQRVRPAHFFVADKCLHVFMSKKHVLHVFLSKKPCLHVFLSKKHVFMSSCLKNMSSCPVMQTFAQPNCVFTPRSATNI